MDGGGDYENDDDDYGYPREKDKQKACEKLKWDDKKIKRHLRNRTKIYV